MLGLVNSIGAIVALLANIIFGTLSDMTRSRFGKRTPWIVGGGIITGLAIGAIAFTRNEALIIFCGASPDGLQHDARAIRGRDVRRVPDKVRGTISGFYAPASPSARRLGSVVGAAFLRQGQSGLFSAWMMGLGIFSLTGIFVVAMWPREKSSCFEEQSEHVTVKSVLLNFRPPRHAPDFYYALVGRTLMMGGYWMITTYQLYIAQDYIYAGDPNAKDKAATITPPWA